MTKDPFPSEVPKPGDLVQVVPSRVDYVVHHYKDFCEEAFVSSRFHAINYEGHPIIEVSLGGHILTEPLRYDSEKKMWLISFDGQDRLVDVKVMMQ